MPRDAESDNEFLEITLRSAAEVAGRLIALAAVVRRCALELDPVGDAEGDRFDLAAWLREEHLAGLLTADEQRLIGTRVGGLAPEVAEDGSWRIEAVAALAWAGGIIDMLPPFDQGAQPGPLLDTLPESWDKTALFRARVVLRGEDEIAAAREMAELWHWRGQIEEDIADADDGAVRQLRDVIREVASDAARAGLFERPLGGDFVAGKRLFRDLSPEERQLMTEIAGERLHALNWLCGFGATWDDTPLDI